MENKKSPAVLCQEAKTIELEIPTSKLQEKGITKETQ